MQHKLDKGEIASRGPMMTEPVQLMWHTKLYEPAVAQARLW